jgi:hypothetical protein
MLENLIAERLFRFEENDMELMWIKITSLNTSLI